MPWLVDVPGRPAFSEGRWREGSGGQGWGRGGRGNCSWNVVYERRINKKEREREPRG